MKRLECIMFFWLAVITLAVGQKRKVVLNTPLDKQHPVELTSTSAFTFENRIFTLDSRHILLDATVTDSAVLASPFIFNNFADAIANCTDGTAQQPMIVYIAPNVYWVDDPMHPEVAVGKNGREPFGMTVRCQNLHLEGLTLDARNVVLASQRGQTQGAVGNFTMFDFHGDGLEVRNLTMGNYCNVDLEYPLDTTLNRKKRSGAITQAHVAYCHGDRIVAQNVRFISRLNMNPLNGAKRILFDRCHMECTDDALTGNGVYLHCDFEFYGQKPFYTTHPMGAVMLDCDFHLKGASQMAYFCKASGPVTLIDCRFHSESDVNVDWAPYPNRWLRCYQSNVSFNGRPFTVGNDKSENTVDISQLPQLKAYKCDGEYNIAGLLAGDDGWNPMGNGDEAIPSPTCLMVTPNKTKVEGGQTVTLHATAWRHSGYKTQGNTLVTWSVEKGFEKYLQIVKAEGDSCIVKNLYDGDMPTDVMVVACTKEGLQGASCLTLHAPALPPPALRGKPTITIDGRKASLKYSFADNTHGDLSDITWFVADDKYGHGAVPVAVSNGKPLADYNIKGADAGKYLMARLLPRQARSGFGDTVTVCKKVSKKFAAHEGVIETDFSDFPCAWQTEVIEGRFTVDGFKPDDTSEYPWSFDASRPMWEYGEGFNGAVGMGLLQAQRGARLRYTPTAPAYNGMEVLLDVDPTKTAGQGFGSATGQYMDVCLKFDNRSLTGYALRIIRTTKYAKAVDFMLIRYDNGKTTAITPPVSAVCYRTGCHIKVRYASGKIYADVTTDTPMTTPDDPNLKTEVHLSADVMPNDFGGFCLQHTGSCGESTTMLHHLKITYDGY